MGIPSIEHDALCDWVGVVIREHIRDSLPIDAKILDVGAGWGKFAKLLPEYRLDACEIWEPYRETLSNLYQEVFITDVCNLDFEYYDAIILSEVLEHIDRPRAKKLITQLAQKSGQLYVSVPYLHTQGEVAGNPHEVHLQDDLTPEIVGKEYPELKPLLILKKRGLYTQ